MDFYNKVPISSLFLSPTKWFDLPNADGTATKVVAIRQADAPFVVVAYTILVTLIFAALLRIVHYLVLAFFPLRGSGNRNVMLVAFYNSTNFTTSAWLMWDYLEHALFHSKVGESKQIDVLSMKASLSLMCIALAMIGGDAAAKFLVGANSLIAGNFATVQPSAIFYPNLTALDEDKDPLTGRLVSSSFEKLALLRTTAAQQAAGRLETIQDEIESRVKFNFRKLPSGYRGDSSKPEIEFDYAYYLTGYDMGILNAPTFRYEVKGNCRTDYKQLWHNSSRPKYDMYASFEDKELSDGFMPEIEQLSPPYININPAWSDEEEPVPGGQSFSITPHTAGRLSFDENTEDPWYLTGENTAYNESNLLYDSQQYFRVKRDRPALNCTQFDTFSHHGDSVQAAEKVINLKGIRISKFLGAVVLPYEVGSPPIIQIGNNMGSAALVSSRFFFANQKGFQASKGSIKDDFQRLVGISFLYSREIVRNTVLLYTQLDGTGMQNLAREGDEVPETYADIILESGDAAALSVYTLIVTPIICLFLWSLVGMRLFWLSHKWNTDQDSPLTRLNLRSAALQATQLYCFLDEKTQGYRKWSDRLSLAPFIKDQAKDRHTKGTAATRDATEISGGVHDLHTTPLLVAVPSTADTRYGGAAPVAGDQPDEKTPALSSVGANAANGGEAAGPAGVEEPQGVKYMIQMTAPGEDVEALGVYGGGVMVATEDGARVDFAQIISDI